MDQLSGALGVVPARFTSSRFPGKPLAKVRGLTVVEHAYRRLAQAPGVTRVLVATDEHRVADAVRSFGGEVVVSRHVHPTGTDRVAEVARDASEELVVNLQLDQPFLSPAAIGEALLGLRRSPSFVMSTLVRAVTPVEAARDRDGVTVVIAEDGRCLYFSRAILPRERTPTPAGAGPRRVWQHIGLYCYRREFLLELAARSRSPLERIEELEQLRALEAGGQILGVPTGEESISFHRREDLDAVESFLAAHEVMGRSPSGL